MQFTKLNAPAWNWAQVSEVVAGHLILGTGAVTVVEPERLAPPYNKLGQLPEQPTREHWLATLGSMFYRQATDAAQATLGMSVDWVALLGKAWRDASLASEFSRQARMIQDGKPFSMDTINRILYANTDSHWRSLDAVEDVDTPFFQTGYLPIDKHSGGIPETLTIIGGEPGGGKTWLAMAMAIGVAGRCLTPEDALYGKSVYMFSREMPAKDLKYRLKACGVSPDVLAKIHVDDRPLDVEAVKVESAKLRDAAIIIVDFLDFFVAGGTEPEYAKAYKEFADAQKLANEGRGAPLVLLAQTNRESVGEVPRKHHLRYSKLAESFGANIYLVLNPHVSAYTDEVLRIFPLLPGRAYIVQDKGRYGTMHADSIGVMEVTWVGGQGFINDDTATWKALRISIPRRKSRDGNPGDGYGR